MSDQLNSSRTSIFAMMASAMAGAAVFSCVVVGGVVIYSSVTSNSDATITEAIGTALGEIEAGHAEAQMMAEADLKHRMALADAEVQRITAFYTSFYQAVGTAAQQATQWEGDLICRQGETASNNNFVETLGTNLFSAGCLMQALSPDSYEATALCNAAGEVERGMIDDFQALPEYRPRYVENVLNDFPHPSTLISDEWRRVRAEFEGAYPDDE